MAAMTLAGHLGTRVTIDSCTNCQAFWFDTHESLQLSPGSTLELFTLIGEHSLSRKPSPPGVLRCPRCAARLLATHDLQRNTPFQYWRCDQHGRFITFFNFLREKSFIRALTPRQIEELRQNIQTVNCSNCGAPIDLAAASACAHCGAPISMLDMKQAGRLVAELQRADAPRPIDPALPLELARAKREAETAFGASESGPDWWTEVSSSGLVEAGLNVVAQWLKKNG